jgi:hypothetical protein
MVSAGVNHSSSRSDASGAGAGHSQPEAAGARWAAWRARAVASRPAIAVAVERVTISSDQIFWRRGAGVAGAAVGGAAAHTCRASFTGLRREAGRELMSTKRAAGSGAALGQRKRTSGAAAQEAAARATDANGAGGRRPRPPRETGKVARAHERSSSGPSNDSAELRSA